MLSLGVWLSEKYIDSKARKLYTDYKELQRNELLLYFAGEKTIPAVWENY